MKHLQKLLFVMHDRPDYPGGPIINYLRLLPKFIEKGYEVHLLAIYHGDYPNAKELSKQGVYIYSTHYTNSEKLVQWILQKAEKIQPNIFIPDVSTQGCFAGKWLKDKGVPVINTHRSPDNLNTGKAIYFSDPQYGQTVTGLVAVNKYLLEELFINVPNSQILTKVIPSGVVVSSEIANMKGDTLRVVYAGRLVEHIKRISLVLEAFLEVSRKNQKVFFTIIGDGPEMENCVSKINSSKRSSNFRFVGMLRGDEYKNELAKHHVIVLLSDFEGTPGALMDGMSCGLIPICLRYPGIEEIIEDKVNGIIVDDRENSFEAAIELLHNNIMVRENVSIAARRTILDKFNVEISVNSWIEFFEDCQNVSGIKKRFKAPRKILLPTHNPILLEDNRLPQKSLMRVIFDLIPYNQYIRKMLNKNGR